MRNAREGRACGMQWGNRLCPPRHLHRSSRELGMFGYAVRGPLVCVTGRQRQAGERSQEVIGHVVETWLV